MTTKKTHIIYIAINLHNFRRPIWISLLLRVDQLMRGITRYTEPHFFGFFVRYTITIRATTYFLKIVTTILIHRASHVRYHAVNCWSDKTTRYLEKKMHRIINLLPPWYIMMLCRILCASASNSARLLYSLLLVFASIIARSMWRFMRIPGRQASSPSLTQVGPEKPLGGVTIGPLLKTMVRFVISGGNFAFRWPHVKLRMWLRSILSGYTSLLIFYNIIRTFNRNRPIVDGTCIENLEMLTSQKLQIFNFALLGTWHSEW